jgi:hypothetical protein
VSEPKLIELGEGSRRQPVATGLVAWKDRRVGEHDVESLTRGPRGCGGTGWTGTDHQYVGTRRGNVSHEVGFSHPTGNAGRRDRNAAAAADC